MKISHKQKGFTLIEMLVATALFSIVMLISVGSLLSLVDGNRKAQALKSVMNNLNFALENISRNMRVGTRFDCGAPGGDLDCSTGGQPRLSFTASDGRRIEYNYNATNEQLEQSIDGSAFVGITAPEVHIEYLRFYVVGASDSDNIQPRVIMVIQGYAGVSARVRTDFNLQTSISQRVLDLSIISGPPPPPPLVTLFNDTFNRANSSALGTPSPGPGSVWVEIENGTHFANIDTSTILLTADNSSRLPIIRSTFARTTTGRLRWTFNIDFERTGSEGGYEIWMQLGDSFVMNDGSFTNGVAIALRWGDDNNGCTSEECFGYENTSGTDVQIDRTSGPASIEVVLDLDAATYDIIVDGTLQASSVSFRNSVSGIDMIRFFVDRLRNSYFSPIRIDTVFIEETL